jgi:hypothetical protein
MAHHKYKYCEPAAGSIMKRFMSSLSCLLTYLLLTYLLPTTCSPKSHGGEEKKEEVKNDVLAPSNLLFIMVCYYQNAMDTTHNLACYLSFSRMILRAHPRIHRYTHTHTHHTCIPYIVHYIHAKTHTHSLSLSMSLSLSLSMSLSAPLSLLENTLSLMILDQSFPFTGETI